MLQVFIHGGAVNEDIVEEDDDEVPQVRLEYQIHSRLE